MLARESGYTPTGDRAETSRPRKVDDVEEL